MSRKEARLLSALALSLVSTAAWAGTQPLGPKINVSTCTTYTCTESSPAVAGAASGAFAVAWEGNSAADDQGISGRFYTKTALPRAVILVNKDKPADQYDTALAADRSGNYVVVWSEVKGNNSDIMAQRVNPAGAALGAAIRVSADPANAPVPPADVEPAVATTSDGGFVVAWIKVIPANGTTPGSLPEVLVRRFNKSGVALGAPVKVSTGLVRGTRPDVCVDSSGRAVVAWISVNENVPFKPNKKGVSLRRLSTKNALLGNTIVVANPLSGESDLALSCGTASSFVLAWTSDQAPAAPDSPDVVAQRFDQAAKRVGAVFRVNSEPDGEQTTPALSHDVAGNFVAAWRTHTDEGEKVSGRRFLANGTADGAEFTVHERAAGEGRPFRPDVAHMGTGQGFIVIWQEESFAVFAQLYQKTAARR